MTPIRGLLKKILGGGSDSPPPAAPSEPRSTRSAAPPPGEMASDDAEREPRRRGSRGGRGRGGSGSAPAATTETLAPSSQRTSTGVRLSNSGAPATASADTAPRSYAWGSRGNDDQTRQRREQASRQRRPATRSFRPLRENLDAPLPEDIAFRAPAEGGDPSILPARRRRPTGLHDTARVLVGGARSLAGWARPFGTTLDPVPVVEEIAPVEPEPPRAALLEAIVPGDGLTGTATADSLIETDEDGENRAEIDLDDAAGDLATAPRRRRGRRGGRGRRRPGTEAGASETPELDEDQPDVRDDVDDFVPPAATLPSPVEEVPADLDEELDDTPVAAPEHEAIREAPRAVRRPRGATAPAIDPADYPAAFAALGVGETTLQALARFGFANPTPIQERAIPALLEGKDVVGVAQTGSGKTIAFGVPMAESLDPDLAEVQGIVLVPTRELAQQVLEVLQDLAAPWGLEAIGILGGHSLASDFKALERRPAIVVGTPGRVIDHL